MALCTPGSTLEPSQLPVSSRCITAFLVSIAFLAAGCGGGGNGGSKTEDPAEEIVEENEDDVAEPNRLDVTLYVENTAGLDRTSEPVRSGVPVPRSIQLTDAASFVVVGPEGEAIPSQVEVTSRWGGAPDDESKPIKWVLVDFFADVPAGSTAVYRLQSYGAASTPAAEGQPTSPLVTADSDTGIVVDTGVARFHISKTRFNLFDRVQLSRGGELVPSDANRGIYMQTADGTRYLAAAGATEVSVEESGPLHAVVVARGKHVSGSGASKLDFTVRMHFWYGRTDSLVSYTFTERDLGSIRSYTAMDEVGIELPANVGASPRYAVGGAQSSAAGALGTTAWQRQTGKLSPAMAATFDPGNADTITYSNGGDAAGSGGKAPGWIGASGEAGAVTAALRWYWQQYPKKLRVAPGLLGVELWPSEEADLRVYAASQKTHEVLFGFHGAGTSLEAAGAASAARLASPLIARCNPGWYASTQVWNRIGVAEPTAYPEEDRQAVAGYFDNLMGVEFPTTFVDRRYDGGGLGHAYGMWNFGDMREEAWSNLAYDTPRSLFIHWAITGDREMFERGVETLVHLRDVDTEHSPRDTRGGITPNRGVPQPWLGRTRYTPTRGGQAHDLGFEGAVAFGFEHHKGQSFADHFFLTGDRLSKEVLAESYHYYEQWLVDAESGYLRKGGGSRTVSHMLNVLLGYYDAYGTDEAKQRIEYVVNYLGSWQRMTSSKDPNGWMWNGTDDDLTSTFMNAVTAESLMLYEVSFPDGIPVRQNLVDAARWTIDPANKQLVNGSQGRYFNAWTNNNYGVSHATVLDPMVAAMLGYAYGVTGERQFVEIAQEVMANSYAYDQSTPYIKAFTQQTRLVPAYLYWLQTEEAKQEAGSAGASP